MAGNVTLDIARLRAYTESLDDRGGRLAGELAHEIETRAQQRAPVRTGFLRSSINAIPESGGRWRVAVGAPYGPFVEFGTHNMGAQPFLIPAAVEVSKEIGARAKATFRP